MSKSVFEFKNYCNYLLNKLGSGIQRSGRKKEFATSIGCQSSFLSQVLTKKVNLSLEQGIRTNGFFNHTDTESHYFMLLLQKERAGTEDLRNYYEAQLDHILENQLKMKSHMKSFSEISEKIQGQFYSSWKYQAVQTLLSIKKLQNPEVLASYLSVPLKEILHILEFLVENNLAVKEGQRYLIGPRNIHLSDQSDFLRLHHFNWRLRTMDSLGNKKSSGDLHYSGVITLSESDALQLRKLMLENLSSNLKFVQQSHEEVGYAICVDLFQLGE